MSLFKLISLKNERITKLGENGVILAFMKVGVPNQTIFKLNFQIPNSNYIEVLYKANFERMSVIKDIPFSSKTNGGLLIVQN